MSGYRPRGNARKQPDKQITQVQAKAQLQSLLWGCTEECLAQFTVDGLAPMYRVPRKEIEYELTVIRQKRAEARL